MKKLFLFTIVVLGFTVSSFSQITKTATTSVTIVTPIAMTKTTDMNFGNVAVDNSDGTVVLSPAGARTVLGGTSLPVITGTVSAATFHVTGFASSTYSISLPSSITLSDGGSHTMIVDAFTSTPTTTGVLTGGSEDINVGATLNVSGSQAAGTYTNLTGLAVTVNYN